MLFVHRSFPDPNWPITAFTCAQKEDGLFYFAFHYLIPPFTMSHYDEVPITKLQSCRSLPVEEQAEMLLSVRTLLN